MESTDKRRDDNSRNNSVSSQGSMDSNKPIENNMEVDDVNRGSGQGNVQFGRVHKGGRKLVSSIALQKVVNDLLSYSSRSMLPLRREKNVTVKRRLLSESVVSCMWPSSRRLYRNRGMNCAACKMHAPPQRMRG